MKYLYLFILIIFTGSSITVNGQETKGTKPVTSFVSDGQEYILYLKKNSVSKIHFVFYPDLLYRITFKQENLSSKIEMKILDKEKKVLYSNKNTKFTSEWSFQFKSIINTTIEFNITEGKHKEETVKVNIDFCNTEKKLVNEGINNE